MTPPLDPGQGDFVGDDECAALSAALIELTRIHHATLTGSQLHNPEARTWADCECQTCRRTAGLLPEQAEDYRRCECRARYGPDRAGPAVARCNTARECAARMNALNPVNRNQPPEEG